LLAQKKSVSKMSAVIQDQASLYFYDFNQEVSDKILSTAPSLDSDDVETVWILYSNPEMKVFGPNDSLRSP